MFARDEASVGDLGRTTAVGDAEQLSVVSVVRVVSELACLVVGRRQASCAPLASKVADDDVDDVEEAVDVVVGLCLWVVGRAVSEL